jgi:AcrR family transcriptional regulator
MTRNNARRHAQPAAAKRRGRRGSARNRVFWAASELFHRNGIRAIGVETIAAQANTTKMSLYRNFPSKDKLVAEWLRDHDVRFWEAWDANSRKYPGDPRRQLEEAFMALAASVADPMARGCPMANAAVEITERRHPARKVIETHKAKVRARLVELCAQMQARDPELLADQLFLLMEGARVSSQTPGARVPATNVARAAHALIDAASPEATAPGLPITTQRGMR